MDCKTCQDQLGLYIENELNFEDKKKVEEHIKKCEVCKEELDMLQYTLKQLGVLPQKELPKDFHTQLMDRLRQENSPSPKQKWYHKPLCKPLAAGVLAASLISILWLNDFGSIKNMDKSEFVEEARDNQIMMEKNVESAPIIDEETQSYRMMGEPEVNLQSTQLDEINGAMFQEPIILQLIINKVMILNEGLNDDMQFVSIDSQIPEMNAASYKENLQGYVKDKYGVEIRFEGMEDLKKAGLWDEDSHRLKGILLQFEEIQFIDPQHFKIVGSKYRSSVESVGFEIEGKQENETWELESKIIEKNNLKGEIKNETN